MALLEWAGDTRHPASVGEDDLAKRSVVEGVCFVR